MSEDVVPADDEEELYYVVMNHEEQYSIWPCSKVIPMGWHLDGVSNSKAACLERIKKLWVDMSPLSLRRNLEHDRNAK